MGLILSCETGTDTCSVALADGGRVVAVIEDAGSRDHAAKLGVFVDDILKANGVSPRDLDAVAVSEGPGSYTGLRIGVSLAKGMCYGLDIPLIAVGTLESLAHMAAQEQADGRLGIHDWGKAHLCPMIDARRMEVYAQVFDSGLNALTGVSAHIITPDSFSDMMGSGEFVIFGSGAEKSRDELTAGNVRFVEIRSSARGMVGLAERAFRNGKFQDVAYFEPFYLKDFVVTTQKRKVF